MRSLLVGLGLLGTVGCGRDSAAPVDGWLQLDDAGEVTPLDAFEKPPFPVTCEGGITMTPNPDKFGGAIIAGKRVGIAYSYDPAMAGSGTITLPLEISVVVEQWTFTRKAGTSCTIQIVNGATDSVTIRCPTVVAMPPIDGEPTSSLELVFRDSKGMMVSAATLPPGALRFDFSDLQIRRPAAPAASWIAGPVFACE